MSTSTTEGPKPSRRGTSSKDVQGSAANRRARKVWLVGQYRADRDFLLVSQLDEIGEQVEEYLLDVPSDDAEASISALMMSPYVLAVWGPFPAARCYRCGTLTHALIEVEGGEPIAATVTPDRIVPGCRGGTYRHDNIRPACLPCNMSTGGKLGNEQRAKRRGKRS